MTRSSVCLCYHRRHHHHHILSRDIFLPRDWLWTSVFNCTVPVLWCQVLVWHPLCCNLYLQNGLDNVLNKTLSRPHLFLLPVQCVYNPHAVESSFRLCNNNALANLEILRLLWNLAVLKRVHRTSPQSPIGAKWFHCTPTYRTSYSKSHLDVTLSFTRRYFKFFLSLFCIDLIYPSP